MIYFISDLHLEESRPDITEAFFYFLDKIESDASQLYILGDFFEAWVGDDENTPLQQSVKKRLAQLTESGVKTFFMAGNRDFLIGQQFSKDTGVEVLQDPSTINLNAEPLLLAHGDSFCTKDLAYMKLRQMLRAPGFCETFLARPLAERLTTARQLREMSIASNKGKDTEIMDVTPEEITKLLEEKQTQVLLHGHTHRPDIHEITANNQPAKRIVLGDWDKHIWYAKVPESGSIKDIKLYKEDFPTSLSS
ncbi:UDP-2,3-diacylglucosamine diphosphatase [Oleiphilus sp. HI0125]|uniref:UDP-2,3-diacylglucosamine diphosphatase n=1 Tax=Oleiphilus sp. HI0125 TaxID=1822266 RepID=UPI0007C3A5B3|nr:UDP-2,3-diacylglucosamine diphosphatase [Oleiphilus sp. HI0125]KZZ59113.1 UDP-2,3-diacylglucosamine diphosphatase [Oleiphilus sp. HI0125]